MIPTDQTFRRKISSASAARIPPLTMLSVTSLIASRMYTVSS